MPQATVKSVSPEDVSSADFREAMSRVASAVHIVTSDGEAGRCGFTATAFNAVSDDPPIILFCVNQKARSHKIIAANGSFSVNTLSHEAHELATMFSAPVEEGVIKDRFLGLNFSASSVGAPLLDQTIMAMDCLVEKTVCAGTHIVVLGRVVNVSWSENSNGLIYQDRQFHTLKT